MIVVWWVRVIGNSEREINLRTTAPVPRCHLLFGLLPSFFLAAASPSSRLRKAFARGRARLAFGSWADNELTGTYV